ncbi:MAG: phosphomannomutase [candidate division WS1 bacterium]|jgi:phosphomannomutase|nr:phosphomannomutase [candidate division WS1 bacterium]
MTDPATRTRCFKAYDIRGRVPDELDEDLAYDIGRAYGTFVRPEGPVAVGYDVRLSSPALADALKRGLHTVGANTLDIGLCGTEVVYFAAAQSGIGGGIMITASHNPMDHNGMKFVRENAIPISGDSGLREIQAIVEQGGFATGATDGSDRPQDFTEAYLQQVLSLVDISSLDALKIVTNAGNGCAGPYLDLLAQMLPLELIFVDHEPDGHFPHGVPNPLLPERRVRTIEAMQEHQATLGVAWDGDFDRCFFFDEHAAFVEGYYLVGLLARRMLEGHPGERIIHDPRVVWNTIEMVEAAGGIPVQSKTGHAFIKERMRAENALYGGEMSAHHYFRDFYYCDSGMIPWLLVAEIISRTGKPLGELVAERAALHPCSGEINRQVQDQQAAISRVRAHYEPQEPDIDETDGLSMTFGDSWRFNLRTSNTEPVIRLNVEARGDAELVREKTEEVLQLIS